jgi:Leucine-rich repeat (LRR) protein
MSTTKSLPATANSSSASPKRETLRGGIVIAGALLAAFAIVGAFYFVSIPLAAGWWLERQNAVVTWNIDENNWRKGGETSVVFSWTNTWRSSAKNSDLITIHKLHRVTSLHLAESDSITNKGLANLRGLNDLMELDLSRMESFRNPNVNRVWKPLSDACVVHLQALSRLETLVLSGNRITDQGLAELAKIRTLKSLDLEATDITDAGLVHLEGLKALRTVDLNATRVTKQAIDRLRTARPDLTIELEDDLAISERVRKSRGAYQ